MRADVYLVENNFATSRARAEALIVRGLVMVDGQVLQKKNKDIKDTSKVKLLGNLSYVSRGGDKLAGALDTLSLSVTGVTALDIGSSTGGFTDCLLQLGTSEVYAVDALRQTAPISGTGLAPGRDLYPDPRPQPCRRLDRHR